MILEGRSSFDYVPQRATSNKSTRTGEQHILAPTPENPGRTKDRTPIQTRITRDLNKLEEKGKLNPVVDIESRRTSSNNSIGLMKVPIHPKEDRIVDLALMQKYRIFIVVRFSNPQILF